MKNSLAILILVSLGCAPLASAKNLKCEIKDSLSPPAWPKEYISLQLDRYVSSVDYVHKVPNADGSFRDKVESLYAGSNRAGYTVTYCNPNDNDYIESLGRISLYSECAYGNAGDRLFFHAHLSTKGEGSINITVLPMGGDTIDREIAVSACGN